MTTVGTAPAGTGATNTSLPASVGAAATAGIIGVEDIRAGELVIPPLGLLIPPHGLLIPPHGLLILPLQLIIPAVAVRQAAGTRPAAANTENSLPTSVSSRTSRCGCRIDFHDCAE